MLLGPDFLQEILREMPHNMKANNWPRGSTGVQRYGCIPRSAANNLGEIPKNWELQISCFEEFFGGENVLGLVPGSLPHSLGYACAFYAPASPPPKQKILGKYRSIYRKKSHNSIKYFVPTSFCRRATPLLLFLGLFEKKKTRKKLKNVKDFLTFRTLKILV